MNNALALTSRYGKLASKHDLGNPVIHLVGDFLPTRHIHVQARIVVHVEIPRVQEVHLLTNGGRPDHRNALEGFVREASIVAGQRAARGHQLHFAVGVVDDDAASLRANGPDSRHPVIEIVGDLLENIAFGITRRDYLHCKKRRT